MEKDNSYGPYFEALNSHRGDGPVGTGGIDDWFVILRDGAPNAAGYILQIFPTGVSLKGSKVLPDDNHYQPTFVAYRDMRGVQNRPKP